MIGIVFATLREAKPFLEAIKAFCVSVKPFFVFEHNILGISPCVVVVSGIGKVLATVATTQLILKYDLDFIINAGICGVLNVNYFECLGKLYRIKNSIEWDCVFRFVRKDQIFKCTPLFMNVESLTLLTVEKPVFCNNFRNKMVLFGDLVDMEGAAVVKTSIFYGVGCDIIKGVSDMANFYGRNVLESHIDYLASNISKLILQVLKN